MSALLATATTSAAAFAHPWGPGPGPLLFILIPLFWILVLGLVFALVGRRRWRRSGMASGYQGHGGYGSFGGSRSAEATLAERFAQGDIDEVEYRARLEVLRANRPS